VFRRVDLARMSFVGYFKDEQGKALSKPRIYSSSGESHGVSRSIGDRGSARACVATPEIRTVVVPFGSGARFMACSDGVWDAFSSDKATRRVSRFVTPQGAAKRMCVYARERMEYRGMHADDITAVVVDIGANARGGDPQCACVVS
jgi:serine/threonine protein phosphatase PrpC